MNNESQPEQPHELEEHFLPEDTQVDQVGAQPEVGTDVSPSISGGQSEAQSHEAVLEITDIESVGESIADRFQDISKSAAEQQTGNLFEVMDAIAKHAKKITVKFGYIENPDESKEPFTNINFEVDWGNLGQFFDGDSNGMNVSLGLPTDTKLSAAISWRGIDKPVGEVLMELPLSKGSTNEYFTARSVNPLVQKALDEAWAKDLDARSMKDTSEDQQ